MALDLKKMTVEELQEVVNNYNAANVELRKREQDKQVEERKEFREGDKFQKLAAKYKKAMERLKACSGKQEVTIVLPLKFTIETDDCVCTDGSDCEELDFNQVFSRNVEGAITSAAEGINKKQRVLLQEGIDNVISQACDTIYGLFPTVTKEQEAALGEFNKVMAECQEFDLCHADFE